MSRTRKPSDLGSDGFLGLCSDTGGEIGDTALVPVFSASIEGDKTDVTSRIGNFEGEIWILFCFLVRETGFGEKGIVPRADQEGGDPDPWCELSATASCPVIMGPLKSVDWSSVVFVNLVKCGCGAERWKIDLIGESFGLREDLFSQFSRESAHVEAV